MSVLVTNAYSAKCLVVARSLGRKDISVTTADSDRFAPTFFSRYSNHHFVYPSANKYPLQFIDVLLRNIIKKDVKVLMPLNQTETLLISKYKNKFTTHTNVPFEDYTKMIQMNDKGLLMQIAEELGLPIPKTYNIENINQIRDIAKAMEYPVVIKLKNATSSEGISYSHTENEFLFKYKNTIAKYNLLPKEYPLVQEYVDGNGYGVSALFNQGDIRAIFTHKRLREYPITGGPSTLRESVRHEKMEKIATDLLKHMNWHGVAMVEFKLDKTNRKPVLIEVNPRFWGSINQAVMSGVDFPYLLYKMAVDGDVKPVLNYKLGVKTRFLLNDFRYLCAQMKTSTKRFQLIRDFLKYDNNLHYDTINKDDLKPAMMFALMNLKKILI